MPQSKTMTSVRIDDDLLAHIDMLSKETHIKKGAIINNALRYYLSSNASQQLLENAGEASTTLRIPDINNVNDMTSFLPVVVNTYLRGKNAGERLANYGIKPSIDRMYAKMTKEAKTSGLIG